MCHVIVIYNIVWTFRFLFKPKYPARPIAIVNIARPVKSQIKFVSSNPYSDKTAFPFLKQGKPLDVWQSKKITWHSSVN